MHAPLMIPSLALCCCVLARAAETAPRPTVRPEPLPPIFAPRAPAKKAPPAKRAAAPATAANPSRRAISSETASKLAAAVAAVQSATPSSTLTGAGAPTGRVDSETDAVLLEPYVVQEEKIPEFKERQILTPKGKVELALKRHPGLKIGSLPFLSNDGVALAMIEEEFAKERRREMRELSELMQIGQEKRPVEVQRKIDEAVLPGPRSDMFPARERQ